MAEPPVWWRGKQRLSEWQTAGRVGAALQPEPRRPRISALELQQLLLERAEMVTLLRWAARQQGLRMVVSLS